jgi:hypothetical protein
VDSKNIFISSQTFLKNIQWQKTDPESEWIYIGNDAQEIKLLFDNIFSKEQLLYLVTDRHQSRQGNKMSILEQAKAYILANDFLVWDIHFSKVIEYNKIGVYRVGKRIFPTPSL